MELEQARIRVKFCGLTREEDVRAAVLAGADAIGFVFYPPSRRALTPARAACLRRLVPAFVSVTALFVNVSTREIAEVLDRVQPDLLQFHGDESPEQCDAAGWRYIRAFRVGGPGMDTPQAVLAAARAYPEAAAWLFDTHSQGYGGSGLRFDHRLLAGVCAAEDARPLVLAGGMAAHTLDEAVARLRPYALDVSSGVEESPGIKSASRMRAFMARLREIERAGF